MKTKTNIESAEIFGVRVDVIELDDAVKLVSGWLNTKSDKLKTVFTPNVEQVMQARELEDFLQTLNQADVNVCDSEGLRWAVNRGMENESDKLEGRIAGIDLAEQLCSEAAKLHKNVFLIGGRTSVAKKAAINLKQRFGNLEIVGMQGPVNAAIEFEAEWKEVEKELDKSTPALVLVAFGAPAQEQWVVKHSNELEQMGVRVAMVVGGAVDVWAGEVKRAPVSWQNFRLEWLWRLLHQPWRIKRQLRLVEFVGRVLFLGGK